LLGLESKNDRISRLLSCFLNARGRRLARLFMASSSNAAIQLTISAYQPVTETVPPCAFKPAKGQPSERGSQPIEEISINAALHFDNEH
jgi:hypothetical protein